MTKDYNLYEQVIQLMLQQDLRGLGHGENVEVKHNVKMRGKTGVEHEIDVTFACHVAGVKLVFIVECKHYNKRVELQDILTFKSRIDDIAAHKGIVVTTIGFQKGAIAFAKKHGMTPRIAQKRRRSIHSMPLVSPTEPSEWAA